MLSDVPSPKHESRKIGAGHLYAGFTVRTSSVPELRAATDQHPIKLWPITIAEDAPFRHPWSLLLSAWKCTSNASASHKRIPVIRVPHEVIYAMP